MKLSRFPDGILKYIAGVIGGFYTFNQIFELLKNTDTYQAQRSDEGSKAKYLYRILKGLNQTVGGQYTVAKIIETFVDPTWWIGNEDRRLEAMNKINEALKHVQLQLNDSGKLLNTDQLITFQIKNKSVVSEIDIKQIFGTSIFSMTNITQEQDLCFVLMPFQPAFDRLYRDHIKKAVVEDSGFKCMRADDIYTPTNVVEDIWVHINKSRVIIADVTGRNPNVFYEMGIAHALKKPVIIITQKKEDVPFDISQIRYFQYTDDELGWGSLRKNITLALRSIST